MELDIASNFLHCTVTKTVKKHLVTNTLLGVPSWVRFCRREFWEFPWLMGRYCSYLLPKQAGGTLQIFVDKTLRMTNRLRVYECDGFSI